MANKISTQLVYEASLHSGQFQMGVTKMSKSMDLLTKAAGRFKNTFLGVFSAYAVIGAIKDAVNTIADFDKAMVGVKVITGATASQFDLLQKSARLLGSTTQYTAKEVANLQLEFGRLGFSTREILQATGATVDLATATGEGLARSAEIAGSTLRAFNMDASQMERVTNAIGNALNYSALTLDSFAEGIKYVAPVAAAMNVSIEETSSLLSVLADAGIKGSQAGTSLRRIFTLLTKDGKPLNDKLQELSRSGITLAGANDEVGLYAQTALLVLVKYKSRVDELTKAFNENQTAIKEMARAMENNLGTQLKKVSTSWDAFILSLDEGKGTIGEIAKDFSDTFFLLTRTEEELKKLPAGARINPFLLPADFTSKYAKQLAQLRAENLKHLQELEQQGEQYVSSVANSLVQAGISQSEGVSRIQSMFGNFVLPNSENAKLILQITKEYLKLLDEKLKKEMGL